MYGAPRDSPVTPPRRVLEVTKLHRVAKDGARSVKACVRSVGTLSLLLCHMGQESQAMDLPEV